MDEMKLPEKSGDQKEPEKKRTTLSRRSCILYLIAGVYLIYTGYTLIKGKVTGAETATWGTAIFGGVFIIVAAVMIFTALRALKILEKQAVEDKPEDSGEKEAETGIETGSAADDSTADIEDEEAKRQKPRSIAERARLVSELGENKSETGSPEESDTEET